MRSACVSLFRAGRSNSRSLVHHKPYRDQAGKEGHSKYHLKHNCPHPSTVRSTPTFQQLGDWCWAENIQRVPLVQKQKLTTPFKLARGFCAIGVCASSHHCFNSNGLSQYSQNEGRTNWVTERTEWATGMTTWIPKHGRFGKPTLQVADPYETDVPCECDIFASEVRGRKHRRKASWSLPLGNRLQRVCRCSGTTYSPAARCLKLYINLFSVVTTHPVKRQEFLCHTHYPPTLLLKSCVPRS